LFAVQPGSTSRAERMPESYRDSLSAPWKELVAAAKPEPFFRVAIVAVASVGAHIAMMRGASAQSVLLPTGATITPNAAMGSVFQKLQVALPDYPNYSQDDAETTVVPSGKTRLILTSGYNL
jgi:hypothetical protein